jgi:NADPH-dependent ferric siderophore reductase
MTTPTEATHSARDLTVQRVRHPLKMRMLQVIRTRLVSPQLLRVTLHGADLADFVSASFDDHVKVFFPQGGADKPAMPEVGPNGPVFAEGKPRPPARDYTPRRYDPAAQELDIEFVLHGDGPASTWAAQAQPGQYLGVGGPRGSFVVPTEFDWHLLVGDETALPAIGRRLEELGANTRALVVVEVPDAAAEILLPSAANVEVHWLHRGNAPEGSLAGTGAAQDRPAAWRRLCLGGWGVCRDQGSSPAPCGRAWHRENAHPRFELLEARRGGRARNS